MATRTRSNAPNQGRPRSGAGTPAAPGSPGSAGSPAAAATAPATQEFPGVVAPTRVSPDEVASIVDAPAEATAPVLAPPQLRDPDALTESGLTALTGTWQSGYVDATWSIDQVRNAYMLVRGVGWKKIYNGRDGSYLALVLLASQARQTGRSISYREEADGMVYEIYLW